VIFQPIRGLLVAMFTAALATAPASQAVAGTYTVRACWGPEVEGWTRMPNVADRGTLKNCPMTLPPSVKGGLHARAGYGSAGEQSAWLFTAPPGSVISGFSAEAAVISDAVQVSGQGWTRGLWDDELGTVLAVVPGPSPAWQALVRSGLAVHRIGVGLRCLQPTCAPAWSTLYGNSQSDWLSVRNVIVTLRDDVAPVLSVVHPPPTGWLGSTTSPITFTASDNLGVAALDMLVDGMPIASMDRRCYDPSTNVSPSPCAQPSAPLTARIDASKLEHGVHQITLRAADAAGNVVALHLSIRVDHNAPAAPRALTLRGGGWRAENRFAVSWTNPPDAGESAVAIADYQLCPTGNRPYDDAGCVSGRVSGDNLAQIDDLRVPDDGEWRLRVSLRDAAGNGDPDRAATVDALKLDREPPYAAFHAVDPLDPTRVELKASDGMSGVAAAEIEMRRHGEAIWRSLGVDERAGRFTSVIDDDQLPDGSYDLRARVVDRAGNDRVTSQLDDGSSLRLVLPIRASTSLEVGRSVRVRIKGSRGKPGGYRRVLIGRPRARFGRPVSLRGRLTDAVGNPRAGAQVEVLERVDLPGMEWRFLTTVHTDARGAFVFQAAPGPARIVRFRYPGTAATRPRLDDVELRVRAGVTLVPSRGKLRNGDTVVFRGELLGRPIPATGKLLALQALTARGWRTFATPRARGRDGRWSYRYHFTGTSATARYAFRALVPTEASYPYAQGVSRVAHVLVFGGG
jgi:hypothetical protein